MVKFRSNLETEVVKKNCGRKRLIMFATYYILSFCPFWLDNNALESGQICSLAKPFKFNTCGCLRASDIERKVDSNLNFCWYYLI